MKKEPFWIIWIKTLVGLIIGIALGSGVFFFACMLYACFGTTGLISALLLLLLNTGLAIVVYISQK